MLASAISPNRPLKCPPSAGSLSLITLCKFAILSRVACSVRNYFNLARLIRLTCSQIQLIAGDDHKQQQACFRREPPCNEEGQTSVDLEPECQLNQRPTSSRQVLRRNGGSGAQRICVYPACLPN